MGTYDFERRGFEMTILYFSLVLVLISQPNLKLPDHQEIGFTDPTLEAAVESLANAVRNGDDEAQATAIQALASMGMHSRKAMPILIEFVRESAQDDQISPKCIGAIRILAKFGSEAQPINSTLVGLLSRQGSWLLPDLVARDALVEIGPDAATVPLLIGVIDGNNADARVHAVYVLRYYGKVAGPAIPKLLPLLHGTSITVRTACVRALVGIGPDGVSALTREYYRTEDARMRLEVLAALTKMGEDAIAAESFLGDILEAAESEQDSNLRPIIGALKECLRRISEEKYPSKSFNLFNTGEPRVVK